ncbi:outer membrane receptor for ferrienterochelin and colicins [Salinimicrobium catena]|uniref:Outer membrane receptor for ferrienterochelin and colicins n=1 Tax=Salinimicrobium catena TaxID=390640 RepID=A0A1H5I6K7_9FLAO|nr:TonB-dependent receptor [Salinimicrobium catena]SDK75253.1 outer membrane receptor for ferrienterochelin and colicins [Salinimicrobium catena]SEE35729.1 outer membrane receptor for ferrienterochelin and colicins [Salinimicrobium catena]
MRSFFTFFLCISVFNLAGQTARVSGTVTSGGNPVEFVNIYLEGTEKGTTTDKSGKYSLEAPLGHYDIVVKAIGYKTIKSHLDLLKPEPRKMDFALQEDITGLDQVVISASRTGQLRHTAPVIVSVTSSKEFKATNSISLSEGLNFQPGLRMETNCQNCGFSQVRMNGLDGAYSQILIDSRPVFSALNGVYGLDQIPANSIDRIEVVRGGGSALYGSNAIAGTINIITKKPTEDHFEVAANVAAINAEAGDKAVTVNGTILSNDFNAGMNVFGMFRDRNPYDHNNDGFTEITTVENNTFGFKSFFKPNDRSELSVDFHTIQEFRRGGNKLHLVPFEADITEQIESEVIGGGITYEAFSKNKEIRYSLYSTAQLSENENFYGGKGETYEESIKGFGNSLDHTYLLGAQFSLPQEDFLGSPATFTAGGEFKNNLMRDRKPGYSAKIDQNLNILGIYAQQEWQATNKLKILGGLRADLHNAADENVVFNPRLNLLYSPTEQLQFRTSYAKGFRAPQVFTEDIHARIAAGEVSLVTFSEDLQSETSHSYLASVEWSKSTLEQNYRLTFESFYTRLQAPFILELISETVYEKRNGEGANVYGLNLDAVYAPNEDWILQMGGTLQKALYDSPVRYSDDPEVSLDHARNFFKSPNIYGNFILTYAPVKNWQNNLSGVYTGSMYVPHLAGYIEKDRLEKTRDFMELNFKTAYTFELAKNFQLELNLGVQNIFDHYQQDLDMGVNRDASYVYGPSRPRTVFVGFKFGNKLLQ